MRQGEIIFTHRLGEQGGYGVIKDSDGSEYLFTLRDVANYFGGDVEKAGLRVGSPVSYHVVGNEVKSVAIIR